MNIKKYSIIGSLLLLHMLLPKPEIDNFHYLNYLIITLVSVLIIVFHSNFRFNKDLQYTLILLFFQSFFIVLASIINLSFVNFSSIFHSFKPAFFAIVLMLGYVVAKKYSNLEINYYLLKSAYFILIIQIVVGVTQLLDISIFNHLYSMDKSRPFGSLVRLTGTFNNPNLFAWWIIQLTILIFVLEENKGRKIASIILGGILVLLSGSRTFFMLYPFIIVLVQILLSNRGLKFYFYKFPLYLLSLLSIFLIGYNLLLKYGEYLPYMSQLLLIIKSGDLSSINSFDSRTLIWNDVLSQFNYREGILKYFFGLGPGTIYSIDNDYLYMLLNYGSIVTFFTFIFYIFLFYKIVKNFKGYQLHKYGVLNLQYLFIVLVVGLQAETLSGWNYPVLIMFYFGLFLGKLHSQKTKRNIAVLNNAS